MAFAGARTALHQPVGEDLAFQPISKNSEGRHRTFPQRYYVVPVPALHAVTREDEAAAEVHHRFGCSVLPVAEEHVERQVDRSLQNENEN